MAVENCNYQNKVSLTLTDCFVTNRQSSFTK